MYIVVGLGNPGKKYEGTRHNVGFHTVDLLADRLNIKVNKLKYKALIGEGHIGMERVLLVKPQTFMNLSGQSVMELIQFYKIDLEQLIVIYDDIDVKTGALRIREKGSAGSHNGMKNIIYLLKEDRFPRIRIGVGKPEGGDLADYVLGRFSKEEAGPVKEAIERAALAVETIISDNLQLAMNKYNG
ncbi:aminoacyl-tRNA hydrolase [Alkaliphilus crotonatoxidans]